MQLTRFKAMGRLRRRYLTALLVIAAVLLVAVPSVLASPAVRIGSAVSPRSLVLHVKDLPPSFTGFIEKGVTVPNIAVTNVDHVDVATITRHGRITGYETILGSKGRAHPLSIMDDVSLFRSVAGAHWQYETFIHAQPAPPHARPLSLAGVGDEATGYFLSSNATGLYTAVNALVYFRRGTYDARVYILGYRPLPPEDVVQLARTLDGRIKRAG